MLVERPKSVVNFEIVAVAGYALLWLSGHLTDGFDLFDTVFYGALIGLALAVTRFRQSWARIANTVLLIATVLIAVPTGLALFEMSDSELILLGIAILAANFGVAIFQLWALWQSETSEWLSRTGSARSIEESSTSRQRARS